MSMDTPVRSPCQNKDLIENVQICATKLVDGLSKLTYTYRPNHLDLLTLVFRHKRADMIECINILIAMINRLWYHSLNQDYDPVGNIDSN